MEALDLHNISHKNAKIQIEDFILKNYLNLPIEIITGNSIDMQNILNNIITKLNLSSRPSSPNNLGSYIISQKF